MGGRNKRAKKQQMTYKKYKTFKPLSILTAAFIALSIMMPVGAGHAHASGEPYQYDNTDSNCISVTQGCNSLSIVSNGGLSQLLQDTYTYKSGTQYEFDGTAGGTITVKYSDPGHGVLDLNGEKTTISIGNTAAFTSFFPQDKSVNTDDQTINVNLAVDFGTTDASLSIPSPDVSIKGRTEVSSTTTSPTANPDTLSAPVINFSSAFPFQPPDTYHICAKADYIKANNNQVCTDATKGTKPLTVSLKARGDASTLPPALSAADAEKACVNSNALGWFLCKIYDGVGGMSTWLFNAIIKPFLHEPPINTAPDSSSYQTWSSFRVYGDIFLVIALLVIVFGESIGGGLIDAYTAKKVLPRLLIAAVLINLSIYIVAILVDITNVLGAGIGDLLTKNVQSGAVHPINLTGAQSGEIGGMFGGAGIGVFLFALLVKGGASLLASGIAYVALVIISIVFFGLLAMFLTLLIRQAAILLLVLISPVAFALYCLPNTEQYFKKWWNLLLELLLVYPIVVAIFSGAQLLGSAIDNADYSSTDPVRPIMAFILQFLPLFFVPFAFRIASKTIGRVNEAIHGVAMRGHEKVGKGLAQQYKQNFSDKSMAQRERAYTNLKRRASKNGRSAFGRFALGQLASQVGGYNMDARISAIQAQRTKEINDMIQSGKDGEARGLSVVKKTALNGLGARWDKDLNDGEGGWRNIKTNEVMSNYDVNNLADYRIGKNGNREFQTLGGGWVSEGDVDRGWARWGHDKFAQQAVLSYEMRKANTDENREHIINGYGALAQGEGGWGMSDDQAQGAWIGPAFENQNSSLQYKYVKHKKNEQTGNFETTFDHAGFVQEVYEKRGSYAMSNMDASTIGRLTEAAEKGAVPREQLEAIAATMQDRMAAARAADPTVVRPTGAEGAPEPTGAALGAGHVYQEMDRFVKAVGPRRGGNNQMPGQDTLF